jgi:hypothetical protein
MPEYVFDNKAPETEQRFGALETLFDPVSIRALEPYVVAGSHCLEVGGGSGSIARWMSQRAGDSGRVLITDIETRFLGGITAPNIEVRRHDIASDPLEEGVSTWRIRGWCWSICRSANGRSSAWRPR